MERVRLGRHTEPERPGVRRHQSAPHLREPERARQYVDVQLLGVVARRPDLGDRLGAERWGVQLLARRKRPADRLGRRPDDADGRAEGRKAVRHRPDRAEAAADGRTSATPILPESYSCVAKLGAKKLAGSGTGGCTVRVPKKKVRGKRLTVLLTINYQGATKVVPLTSRSVDPKVERAAPSAARSTLALGAPISSKRHV